MPAWDEYKTIAQERGSLAHELYVVFSEPAAPPEQMKEHLPGHLAYQAEQEKIGSLVMAGPMSDPSGELMEGVGMIIYRAESLDAARELAQNDPMHSSGTRTFSIRRWLVNEGSITLNVKLSAQSITL
ncbi:YciI family protein [Granulosicoccus sp.]|nr:YciI family protein [Granulosicoccus sp.]MDB4224232.1 YciI family protein [Granulosicoccus sp.]